MADTLGSLLRKKRESLGLTLEQVEEFTRIRIKHLEAIESDDLSSIPSIPQARGFIRNYASFLDIGQDEIAERLSGTRKRPSSGAGLSSPAGPPPTSPHAPAAPPGETRPRAPITAPVVHRSEANIATRPLPVSRMRSWFRLDRILGIVVTWLIVALLAWGGYHIVLSMQGSTELASTGSSIPLNPSAAATVLPAAELTPEEAGGGTVPAIGATLTEEPAGQTPEETVSAGPPAATPGTVSVATLLPTAFPTPLGGVYTDVRIHIIVLQRAYLEVTVDGKIEPGGFSGRVLPDETYDFIGRQTVTVSTGNGAGIRVIFNGVDEGTMGHFGEVVSRIYTPTGIIAPTPSPSLTPSVTSTPTVTLKP
jgi:cytoskeletal protein RodZ